MSDESEELDFLDPDYRSFEKVMERRQWGYASMNHLNTLSRQLKREADEEQSKRQPAESSADREKREARERRLMELVIRANAETDPGEARKLWEEVDAMMMNPESGQL